jgi:glutamate-1-semialdehyde 2,1-aminomutase
MSAGMAMIRKIHKTSPYEKLATATADFGREAEALCRKYSRFPAKVQSYASLFWMVCGETGDKPVRAITDIPSDQKPVFAKFFHGLLERGVYLAPSGYEVGFVSTVHGQSEFSFVLEKMEEVFREW